MFQVHVLGLWRHTYEPWRELHQRHRRSRGAAQEGQTKASEGLSLLLLLLLLLLVIKPLVKCSKEVRSARPD